MKYFLLIVGIFFNLTAKAEWIFAGEFNLDSGQVYEYYDNDLVKSGNIRKIWVLRNHANLVSKPSRKEGFFSQKILLEFNCKARLIRVKEMIEYSGKMGGGRVVSSLSSDAVKYGGSWLYDWGEIVPDTNNHEFFKILCSTNR